MPLLTNRLQFWGYQQKQTKTVVGPYYDSPKKRVLKMEIRGAPYWAVQGLSKKLGLFLSCRMHFKLPGLALVVQIVQYFWCDYCPCHQCHPGTMAGSEFPRWLTTKDFQQLQVIFIVFWYWMLTLACFNPLTPLNTWLHHTSPPSCLSGSRWSEKEKEKASQLPRWRRCKGRCSFACCFPAICLSSLMVLWCYN